MWQRASGHVAMCHVTMWLRGQTQRLFQSVSERSRGQKPAKKHRNLEIGWSGPRSRVSLLRLVLKLHIGIMAPRYHGFQIRGFPPVGQKKLKPIKIH